MLSKTPVSIILRISATYSFRNIRTARNRCLPCRHLPMRMTIQDSGVATGRTLLTVAGRYGHADGTATNRRRTLSARSRQRTVSRCSMIMTTTIRIRRLEWLRLRNGTLVCSTLSECLRSLISMRRNTRLPLPTPGTRMITATTLL